MELLELYKKCSHSAVYKKIYKLREKKLAFRQMLNVEIAIYYCRKRKIDYLLHIDVDELFYLNGYSIYEYFNDLNNKRIYNKRFLNYEAVPEKKMNNDYFENISLFKINKGNHKFNKFNKKIDFQSYSNGKSVINVNYNFHPTSVTSFRNFNIPKTINLIFSKLKYINLFKFKKKKQPIILHYCCCNFDVFSKKILFSSQYDLSGFINKALNNIIDIDSAIKFYQDYCIFSNTEEVINYIEKGLLCRIKNPSINQSKS